VKKKEGEREREREGGRERGEKKKRKRENKIKQIKNRAQGPGVGKSILKMAWATRLFRKMILCAAHRLIIQIFIVRSSVK